MVREIVFDTETTGFDADKGDRLVEIGAIELINHIPTGKVYHQYINPQREVPEEAFKVHGLSYDFLKDFPTFDQIVDEWLDFVGEDGILVAHNAKFDITFCNFEQKALNKREFSWDKVIDTLEIARNMFPGSRVNLDALCKRFNIDNSNRTKHGALLDAELLAEVYLQLIGGQEPAMMFDEKKKATHQATEVQFGSADGKVREARHFLLSEEEINLHNEFLQNKIKGAIWLAEPESENKE